MINNTIQNKSSKIEKVQGHELAIINQLKNLYSSSELKIKYQRLPLIKELKWFHHIFYNNPISLLFSIDQFFFEFAKKQPRRKKTSEFQRQLKERKKLSFFYGYLSKKQLKNLISQSKKYQGYFSKNFFSLLERRLDIVLYRSGFVKNIVTARQLIAHKKIKVNNQILNIASYQVNPGDIISLPRFSLSSPRKKRKKLNDFPKLFSLVHNLTNWKSTKQKKLLKNYISLLLTKIEKRVHGKIEKTKSVNFLFNEILRNENKKNFTLLKFKPLLSKQAQLFLFQCMQKNYLSVDRKPLFSNKYPYFNEFSILQNKKVKKNFPSFPSFQEKGQKRTEYSLIYSGKRNTILYRNFVSRTLLLMHSSSFYSSPLFLMDPFLENKENKENKQSKGNKKNTNTLLTLKLKKNILKKRTERTTKATKATSNLRLTVKKPIHLEVSYSLSTLIFLYSPQRLNFPFYIDVDLILRSFQ